MSVSKKFAFYSLSRAVSAVTVGSCVCLRRTFPTFSVCFQLRAPGPGFRQLTEPCITCHSKVPITRWPACPFVVRISH